MSKATPYLGYNPVPVKKHKRGDTREDGKRFWRYTNSEKDGERWLSPVDFELYSWKLRDRQKKQRLASPHFSQEEELPDPNLNHATTPLVRDVGYRLGSVTSSRFFTRLSGYEEMCELLGCSLDYLKKWVEKQFLPGMSWANLEDWRLTFRVPLRLAQTSAEARSLACYQNLYPEWRKGRSSSKYAPIPTELPSDFPEPARKIWERAIS